jgi:hypothetical protein
MAVKIQWQPPLVPEERKKAQWENIIRFELGEAVSDIDVSLRFEEEKLGWRLETPAVHEAAFRGRLVDALRAAGKPAV